MVDPDPAPRDPDTGIIERIRGNQARVLPPSAVAERPRETRLRLPFELDPWLTLSPLAHGTGDPTVRRDRHGIWRATRTPDGPATVLFRFAPGTATVTAWGPGAERALSEAPRVLGAGDDPSALRPRHALVRELVHRLPGLRLGRTDAVFEALLPAVVEQKVTGIEARRSYRALIRRYGEDAPGPGRLRLPPPPGVLARLPAFRLHPLGLEQRRADVLRRAAIVAPRLEEASRLPPQLGRARLRHVRGIGEWTAAETARVAWGDPDAISVGDFHVPSLVSWVLAGEPRGDDARMLELLEPYRGQRARVVRLLEAAGLQPPRFGPRMPPRSISAI